MSSRTPTSPGMGFLLKRAQHAFRTRVDNALRPFELTAPQYAVLAAVDQVAGVSNADLARFAFVTPQTMQGILANLERAGLLTRTQHPGHGRILSSALTAHGSKVLARARTSVDDVEQRIADAIGPDDLPAFAAMLARCAEQLGTT